MFLYKFEFVGIIMDRILLEESCEILDSRRIPITASNRKEGPYPYYGANGIQDYVDDYIFDDELVLLAEDGGNFGSKERPIAYRVSGKCWVNNHAHVLKPKDGMNVDYLCYSLMFYDTEKLVNGATRQKLTQAMMRKILIPKRSISEQKKIVDTLNTIQNSIAKQTKRIKLLDNLIKARFVEMFGTREKWNDANWKIASIDEIIEKPKSGEWGQKDESGRGIGVIRTTNFSDGGAVYFNSITTRDIPREKLITKGIKNGDILIEKSGGSDKKPVGRVVLYTGESNKYLNNNFTAILRINNNTEVNNIFLFTFLYINYWQGGTKVFESKTTGIHNLNLKEFLNKTKIALPDMLLQNQFATFVAQVDKSKFAVQKSLEKTQLLFDSLMQEYFG